MSERGSAPPVEHDRAAGRLYFQDPAAFAMTAFQAGLATLPAAAS